MSDVSCVCCSPVVAEIRARGFAPEPLVEGLGFDLATLENPRRRVPWDPFTEFAHRAAETLGGAQELEEIAARAAADTVPAFLRRLLPYLGSVRPIYLMGARWWGPWVFRGTRATCEELADGRLREVIRILPGHRESPEFFHGLRGVMRAMPRLFGQPDAVVELEQDGRRGEFIITPPPGRRRLQLVRRRRAPLAATPADLEELGFRQEQLRESLRRARQADVLLEDQSHRLDSIRRLGRELLTRRGGRDLGDVMVRLVAERLPVRGVRLSQRHLRGDAFGKLAECGEPRGGHPDVHPLRVGGRTVGLLELWFATGRHAEGLDADWLGEILPWLALAVENLRRSDAVDRLARWVEEELDESRIELALDLDEELPESLSASR
jgi:hypothetical protein